MFEKVFTCLKRTKPFSKQGKQVKKPNNYALQTIPLAFPPDG